MSLKALIANAQNYAPPDADLSQKESGDRVYLPFCGKGTLVIVTDADMFINFGNAQAKEHTMAGMSLSLYTLLAANPELYQLKPKQSKVTSFEELKAKMGTDWKGFVQPHKDYSHTLFMAKVLANPMLREGAGSPQNEDLTKWMRGVHNVGGAFIGEAVDAALQEAGINPAEDPKMRDNLLAHFTLPRVTKATILERLAAEGITGAELTAALKKHKFESVTRYEDEPDAAFAARSQTARCLEPIMQDDKGKQKQVGWQAVLDVDLLKKTWEGRFAWVESVAWKRPEEKGVGILHQFTAVTEEEYNSALVQEALETFQAQEGA